VLVPQQAVQRDSAGNAQVFVVSADNKAGVRQVKTGRAIGTNWVVTEGLANGEKVIVEGFQKVQPGGDVVPADWQPQAAAPEGGEQQPAAGEAEKPAADGEAQQPAADAEGGAEPAEQAK
jgi:membrane fusion protein, multidrug efflux system